MGSAAGAKVGGVYVNYQQGEETRTALQEMGHSQPPTIVATDNSTANGFVNNQVDAKHGQWNCNSIGSKI
eukprot:3402535-Ditylum_brightwellii.AAC.1